ncbi:MAG: hypothetical protein ABIS86_01490 [Streptosporangiaceae bacterium]
MRKPPRTALLAAIITIGLMIAAVVMSGILVVVSIRNQVVLASPLLVYPVVQQTSGPCPAGSAGSINGPEPSCYLVASGLTISKVSDVHVEGLKDGTYALSVKLLSGDRSAFAKLTRANLKKQVALVVNGKVITAPRIDDPITGGRLLVTGQFTKPAADQLALELTGS